MTVIAQWAGLEYLVVHRTVGYVLVGIMAALLVGTGIRLVAIRTATSDVARKRLASLGTWWIIALLFSIAVLLGRLGIVALFGLISFIALREYMTLVGIPYRDSRLAVWMYAVLTLNYVLIAMGWIATCIVLVPLLSLLVIAVGMVLRERSDRYLLTSGSLYWGMILTVYCVSHAALLVTLPETMNAVAGPIGWLLYLVLLTELSDISQALVGRRIGKRPIAPVLSPHKTWEGLLGGIGFTTIMAALLAPILTSLADASFWLGPLALAVPYLAPCLAGIIICIAGYFGDLNISGIKRDMGVKDSGHMLPGQGGILDRIDSLMFTAPLFYYFVRYGIDLPSQ